MLSRISWWRMTADFTCPECGHQWTDAARHKDTVFPYINFLYYDPGDPYLIKPENKTISIQPARCLNGSCQAAKELYYELTVPLEFVKPGSKELRELLSALDGERVRMHDDDKEQLWQEIKAFLSLIPKDSELVWDGDRPMIITYAKKEK